MGAVAGSVGGMGIALIVWLVAAKITGGEITVDTLSYQWVSFAGNLAAILSGGILSVGLSLWRPANFDWEKTRQMEVVREEDDEVRGGVASSRSSVAGSDEKNGANSKAKVETHVDVESAATADGLDLVGLERTYKFYGWVFAALALIVTIVNIFSPSGTIPTD